MAVAQLLPEIAPGFMQICPLCKQNNRIVIKGIYRSPNNPGQQYPDMGYSFCNCRNIFYTNYENIATDEKGKKVDFYDHHAELKKCLEELAPGWRLSITMADPFFCEWSRDPNEFDHWNPRRYHIIWDMEEFCDELCCVGFDIVKAERDFRIDSELPQSYVVTMQVPPDENNPVPGLDTKLRCAAIAAIKHFGDKEVIVAEVGVLQGDNAVLMLDNWKSLKSLALIDHWNAIWDYPDQISQDECFEKVLNRFNGNKRVKILPGNSVAMAKGFEDGSLDFVYIDAGHLYDDVKSDIEAWLPKIKKGGMIGGHDYDFCLRTNNEKNVKLWPKKNTSHGIMRPFVKEAVDDAFGNRVCSGENQNTVWDWWVFI